jgi:hypothetical protein
MLPLIIIRRHLIPGWFGVVFLQTSASFFNFGEESDDIGFFSKLKTAKALAQVLTDNHLTLSIFRKGKEALSLGYETHPTLSRLTTPSDDILIDSVKEVAKLKHDVDNSLKRSSLNL